MIPKPIHYNNLLYHLLNELNLLTQVLFYLKIYHLLYNLLLLNLFLIPIQIQSIYHQILIPLLYPIVLYLHLPIMILSYQDLLTLISNYLYDLLYLLPPLHYICHPLIWIMFSYKNFILREVLI